MKRLVGLLLALAMMLGAAGALAAALPNGSVKLADGITDATPCSVSGIHSAHNNDYCFYSYGVYSYLNVLKSGLTISGFQSGDGFSGIRIMIGDPINIADAPLTLTLDGVRITVPINAVSYMGEADLILNLKNNTLLNGGNYGIHMQDNNQSASLTVTGDGTIEGGNSGIHVQDSTTQGAAVCTLGGNLTVSGGNTSAVALNTSGSKELKIAGDRYRGIMLLAGDSPANAAQINIYDNLVDVYGIDAVKNAKYISTQTPTGGGMAGGGSLIHVGGMLIDQPAADLPQTGDSSSLALWLGVLALAGAAMTARRKREA